MCHKQTINTIFKFFVFFLFIYFSAFIFSALYLSLALYLFFSFYFTFQAFTFSRFKSLFIHFSCYLVSTCYLDFNLSILITKRFWTVLRTCKGILHPTIGYQQVIPILHKKNSPNRLLPPHRRSTPFPSSTFSPPPSLTQPLQHPSKHPPISSFSPPTT